MRTGCFSGAQSSQSSPSWVARLGGGSWVRDDGPPRDSQVESEAGQNEGGNARGWKCPGNDRQTTGTDSKEDTERRRRVRMLQSARLTRSENASKQVICMAFVISGCGPAGLHPLLAQPLLKLRLRSVEGNSWTKCRTN